MGEQHREAIRAEAYQSEPDDSEPAPQRQAEIWAAYERNVAEGRNPYEDIVISTRGELAWVLGQPQGDVSDDVPFVDDVPVMNLSGIILSGANLPDINLAVTTLTNAHLQYANLSRATFFEANLSSTDLRGTTLNGADLRGTTLWGADLRESHMDADTCLTGAIFNSRTSLVDVVWNGVPVTRLNWQDITMIGDETEARDPHGKRPATIVNWRTRNAMSAVKRRAKGPRRHEIMLTNGRRLARLLAYEDAVLANRQVVTVMRGQGVNEHAAGF